MKKSFQFAMLSLAALAMTCTSCSNDNDVVNPVDGEKGKIAFSFVPVGLSTKALDLTHTSSESAVSTVTLFVYKADGSLELVQPFGATDLTNTAGVYALNAGKEVEVVAETGKQVYVGVNMPATLVAAIRANSGAGMSMATAYTEAIGNMTTANNFTMFSDAATSVNVTAGATANATGIAVSRLMAKVSVKYDETALTATTISVAGGKIDRSSLKWAVENTNTAFRILQPNGTTQYSPLITPATPPAITAYKVITGDDPTAAAAHDPAPEYVMENIPDLASAATASDVITYVRIRCDFTPDQLLDGTGASAGAGSPGSTFWTVPNPSGGVAYFGTLADATAWSAAHGGGAVTEYTAGECEYGIFITKNAGQFDIVRNHYYAVTINAINGIGVPVNPSVPITPTAKGLLKFELQVNDWIDNSTTEPIS